VGGGTGLSAILRGLKELCEPAGGTTPPQVSISAIVTVSDNGGSPGPPRDSFGIPALGDLRKCLLPVSGTNGVARLLPHRLSGGNGLDGHSLGNLIVTALFQMSGSLVQAIDLARVVLGSTGRVLPVTETPVTLCAELASGKIIRGECEIANAGQPIARLWL